MGIRRGAGGKVTAVHPAMGNERGEAWDVFQLGVEIAGYDGWAQPVLGREDRRFADRPSRGQPDLRRGPDSTVVVAQRPRGSRACAPAEPLNAWVCARVHCGDLPDLDHGPH